MQKNTTTQPAQIGVVAVLLTTVLLAVGISVTTRVVDQVAQETARTESNQSLNVAESNVDIAAGLNDSTAISDFAGNSSTAVTDLTGVVGSNMIYLQVGDSVEVKYDSATGDIPSNIEIYWGRQDSLCTSGSYNTCPALLLSWYPAPYPDTVYYYPITSPGMTSDNRTGYTEGGIAPDPFAYTIKNNSGSPTVGMSGPGTLRIKALYSGTYISMDGLTTTTRAAAANEAGNEVRVAEQQQTAAAAPFVMDYALFAGDGSIGQN